MHKASFSHGSQIVVLTRGSFTRKAKNPGRNRFLRTGSTNLMYRVVIIVCSKPHNHSLSTAAWVSNQMQTKLHELTGVDPPNLGQGGTTSKAPQATDAGAPFHGPCRGALPSILTSPTEAVSSPLESASKLPPSSAHLRRSSIDKSPTIS